MKAITLKDFYEDRGKGDNKFLIEIKEEQTIDSFKTLSSSINPGEIVVIASRSGEGKTTFLHNLLLNHVREKNETVLLMSVRNFPETNLTNLIETIEKIEGGNEIDQNKVIVNSTQINSKFSAINFINNTLFQNKDIKAIYVDDIQALSWYVEMFDSLDIDYDEFEDGSNNYYDLGKLFKFLMSISVKRKIPIILTADLKRKPYYGSGTRLSDILIEKLEIIADKVYTLFRPEHHGIFEDAEGNSLKDIIEINVDKNKNGESGKTIRLTGIGMTYKEV